MPLFVERYMIPVTLAWAILLAYLASRIIELGKSQLPEVWRRKRSAVVLWAFALILIVQPLTYAWSFLGESFPGMEDAKYGYRDLPIVTSQCYDFMRRFHYSPERSRYFFVMDWEAALDVRSGLSGPEEYKTMDALKREYPEVFDDHIIQLSDFLSRHDRFLVLADRGYRPRWTAQLLHYPRWLDVRIQSNPAYQINTLGMIDGERLLLVEKVEAAGR